MFSRALIFGWPRMYVDYNVALKAACIDRPYNVYCVKSHEVKNIHASLTGCIDDKT